MSEKKDIEIYDSKNWEVFLKREYKNLSYTQKKFLGYLLSKKSNFFIRNSRTNLKVISVDNFALPFTVNSEDGGFYLDSVNILHITYPVEELKKFGHTAINLGGLEEIKDFLDIQKYIYLNNWLLTTNQPQYIPENILEKIKNYFIEKYTDYLIISRGIPEDAKGIHDIHKNQNFRLIPYRPVWVWHYPPSRKRSHLERDMKLLAKRMDKFQEVTHLDDELAIKIMNLYRQLYINKYTQYSTDFTHEWFKIACASGLFKFDLLYEGEELKGFLNYSPYNRGGLVLNYLGYDCFNESEKQNATYRTIFAKSIQNAQVQKCDIFLSGGCGGYKENRGAVKEIEYEGYYIDHLPPDTKKMMRRFLDLKS